MSRDAAVDGHVVGVALDGDRVGLVDVHQVCDLAEQRIALRVEAPGAESPVDADPSQIEQVLTNLVMNAIQASPDDRAVEVSVDLVRTTPPSDHGGVEASFARVRVKDEGRGIPAEILEHVFEPFFTTKDNNSITRPSIFPLKKHAISKKISFHISSSPS